MYLSDDEWLAVAAFLKDDTRSLVALSRVSHQCNAVVTPDVIESSILKFELNTRYQPETALDCMYMMVPEPTRKMPFTMRFVSRTDGPGHSTVRTDCTDKDLPVHHLRDVRRVTEVVYFSWLGFAIRVSAGCKCHEGS